MRFPLAVALAALAACATKTRPLDRTRPLEIDRSWGATTFKQDGVPVENVDVVSALTSTPAGRDHVREGTHRGLISLGLLAAAGTVLVVGAVGVDDPALGTGLALGGLAACGGSIYFHQKSQSSFAAAAREYNASLQQAVPAGPSSRARPPPAATRSLSLSLAF